MIETTHERTQNTWKEEEILNKYLQTKFYMVNLVLLVPLLPKQTKCYMIYLVLISPLLPKLTITKTRLFKYIENFTTKKGKFSDKKI